MDLRLLSSKCLPLLAVAALALVSSAAAQGSVTNGGRSIIFSTPDNTEISSNLTSLATPRTTPANFKSVFQDTAPAFNNFAPSPGPAPLEQRRFQKSSNQRPDWVFMTPAEIMGVAPEQLFNRSTSDEDNQREGSLTPTERYVERQSQPARTNSESFSRDNPFSPQGFWSDGNGQATNGDSFHPISGSEFGDVRSTILNQSLNDAPNNNLLANPKVDSVWSKLFGSPVTTLTPGPDAAQQQQQQSMDQFQQLLNPVSTPVTTTISPGGTTFTQPQTSLSDSDSTQPLANPVGASFTPLSSGIGEPAGLTQLPGIIRQSALPSVTAPAWAPQPAPWMSQTPQPFAVPQRKF